MEALNRLVTDSLVRHGFDRPIDPRRLQWSRWYPCNSPHSLLVVPSKPGIFAIAEEVMNFGPNDGVVATDAAARQTNWAEHEFSLDPALSQRSAPMGSVHSYPLSAGAALQRSDSSPDKEAASAADGRMLAVLQFSEADDMAFTLDRMFTRPNPMRDRLTAGRCFLRFVALSDDAQRRSICAALNQWMLSSAEQISVPRAPSPASAESAKNASGPVPPKAPTLSASSLSHLDSEANKNLYGPQPLPSGF
jgi:hypothetical protein